MQEQNPPFLIELYIKGRRGLRPAGLVTLQQALEMPPMHHLVLSHLRGGNPPTRQFLTHVELRVESRTGPKTRREIGDEVHVEGDETFAKSCVGKAAMGGVAGWLVQYSKRYQATDAPYGENVFAFAVCLQSLSQASDRYQR